jgi:hypothetical protein
VLEAGQVQAACQNEDEARVEKIRMKQQQMGRTNGFVLGFLVGRTAAKAPTRGELGMGQALVAKWTVQIDRQQERTTQDKLNSVRIKPTIATLIQCYIMAIVSG